MLKDFNAVKITIASPQDILDWSFGEVTKAETINYRTFRAEPQGLMAEEIFGPTKDYECYCGKYKKIRYKGIVCDRCGVEVTTKRVRRERMGHVKLACPIAHLWFANSIPNKLANLLDIPQKKLQTVIYYARYVVTSVNAEEQKKALENLPQIKLEEIKVYEEELEERLKELSEEFELQISDAKKESKDINKIDLQIERIKNKEKIEIAKIKSAFKQKVDSIEEKFNQIKTLISDVSPSSTLSEDEYNLLEDFGFYFFEAGMGAEAIKTLLDKLSLEDQMLACQEVISTSKSSLKVSKAVQRLRIIQGLIKAGTKPSWLILELLPVIPPEIRPIIQLPGGRFATTDLNDLYRRIINRNNRLKRLISLGAPEIILRNEKRMLQQSVDALFDNSHMPSAPALDSRGMPFKSISDNLRGKGGRFRQNLLGKRVDYSGRAVIVAGPDLKFDECGLPKHVALELFRPFIIRELIGRGLAANPTRAKIVFEQKSAEVWDILDEVIKDRPVLLNRAPTLHRYGILAFYPILIEGNAIRLHPMVVKGFNADFDGDQMAIHIPLSDIAVAEAKERMFAKDNILHVQNSSPIVNVTKDMAMGIYYLTLIQESENNKLENPSLIFSSTQELLAKYELEEIKFFEPVKVLLDGKIVITSVGRILFNQILPAGYDFINKSLNVHEIASISSEIFNKYGTDVAIQVLDKIKYLGFKFGGDLGWSVAMEDFRFGAEKVVEPEIVKFKENESELYSIFELGFMSETELENQRMQLWESKKQEIQTAIWEVAKANSENRNLIELEASGAVPVKAWLKEISGVKGTVMNMDGNFITLPLIGNYEKGLNHFEYFAASKQVRKNMSDVGLKTANAGYLTRRLVDVAQDLVVKIENCFTNKGITVSRKDDTTKKFDSRIRGRFLSSDVIDKKTGEIIYSKGTEISFELAETISGNANIEEVKVRSIMTCNVPHGVCQKCYGYDNTTRKVIKVGEAVGISAAQAIGEVATQLTLKSKSDARSGKSDITQGLPRVDELIEARPPKVLGVLAEFDGTVKIFEDKKKTILRLETQETKIVEIPFDETSELVVKDGAKVKAKEVLFVKGDKSEFRSPVAGETNIKNNVIYITALSEKEIEYKVDSISSLLVENNEEVTKGQALTAGAFDPKDILRLAGMEKSQKYIINEAQKIYSIQGQDVDDRHLEVIVRQMSRYSLVTGKGDSDEFFPGDYADTLLLKKGNIKLASEGREEVKFEEVMLGITNASIKTESFLSAASFEQQVRVLTDAALSGKVDHLRGLKENVIIGRPVPLGKELERHNGEEILEAVETAKILSAVENI